MALQALIGVFRAISYVRCRGSLPLDAYLIGYCLHGCLLLSDVACMGIAPYHQLRMYIATSYVRICMFCEDITVCNMLRLSHTYLVYS